MLQTTSLAIDEDGSGRATLRIGVDRDGQVVHECETGSIIEMRDRAAKIANAQDLVPIWTDSSWIRSNGSRPPPSRWEPRRSR